MNGGRGGGALARSALPAAIAALMLTALAATAAFAQARPRPSGSAAVPQQVTFYFGLERPEQDARRAFFAVGDPGSASYRRFTAIDELGRRFGAARRTRRALRQRLARRGFEVRIDPLGVFARVRGSVARFERLLGVRIESQFNNDTFSQAYFPAAGRTPRLPKPLRPLVRELVPAYQRSVRPPRGGEAGAASATAAATAAGAPANAGTWTGGCAAARATGAYSFDQVRHAYGLDAVGEGEGATVAILNVGEGIAPRDITAAAACFGLGELRARTLLTDGQRRPFGRGTFEPQEDLALARGMAPGLRRVILTQAWLDPELWFLGLAQVLRARRLPDALSISYGQCERDVRGRRAGRGPRGGARLLDALAVRLGLAGVATFASAGDFGSTCNGQPFAGVTWPASSRYVTAVGGTRLVLDPANERVGEVVWNDLEWLSPDDGGGAGGGGIATVGRRLPYQSALGTPGKRRAVPDLSAHASLLPGWPVVLAGNWIADAGTSASAPLLAGGFAVLGARERAAGRPPLGPVNGLVYDLIRTTPAALFDVISGDNGYDASVPARQAAPGYDLATGLGVPRFDRLAAALPPPAP